MAKWCRKCIYLKPKLQKLFKEEFPDVPLVFIDVNAVPGNLVTSNGIRVGSFLAALHTVPTYTCTCMDQTDALESAGEEM